MFDEKEQNKHNTYTPYTILDPLFSHMVRISLNGLDEPNRKRYEQGDEFKTKYVFEGVAPDIMVPFLCVNRTAIYSFIIGIERRNV